MQTWTETSQVKHHWVMSQTERDVVLELLDAAFSAGELSTTKLSTVEALINAANTTVSGS